MPPRIQISSTPTMKPVLSGRLATNGDFVPGGNAETYAYNPDNSIKSITTVFNGVSYVETFSYVNGQLAGSTGLVVQP